jgi:transposase
MDGLTRFKVFTKRDKVDVLEHDGTCQKCDLEEVLSHVVVEFMMSCAVYTNQTHSSSMEEFFQKNGNTFDITILYGNCMWTETISAWDKNLYTERINELYQSCIEEESRQVLDILRKLSDKRNNIPAILKKVQEEKIKEISYEQWDAMIGSYEDEHEDCPEETIFGAPLSGSYYGSHFEGGYDSF